MYIVLTIISVFAIYFFFLIFPTQWLKIEHIHQPLNTGVRILQISDLHVDMLRISPVKLRAIIERCAPDYIMLTGDYTSKSSSISRLERYFKTIAERQIPVYAVLGNHDYQNAHFTQLLELFEKLDIVLLRNESRQLKEIQLVGIDDYSTGHSKVSDAFSSINTILERNVTVQSKPVVVITHDPNVLSTVKNHYDYMMAGHFHGKQFNIPFFFRLKPKGVLPAKGVYKGLHKMEYGMLYISKGIGQTGLNNRFMVRSEVTIHDL